jgi:hypothetical protein
LVSLRESLLAEAANVAVTSRQRNLADARAMLNKLVTISADPGCRSRSGDGGSAGGSWGQSTSS